MRYFDNILTEVSTWCDHDPTPDPIAVIKYGALYNWYAATDAKLICANGWHVPTVAEIQTMAIYLGGTVSFGRIDFPNSIGGNLKESGLTYWDSPNTGADNVTNFNAKGSSYRDQDTGAFGVLNLTFYIHSSDNYIFGFANYYGMNMLYNTSNILNYSFVKKTFGAAIRPIKDSTTLSDGETGTYTGNDGKVYRTICIGTQEWLADNLAETKYRDDSDIPIVTDNTAWAALATGAMCYYNNDITYAIS